MIGTTFEKRWDSINLIAAFICYSVLIVLSPFIIVMETVMFVERIWLKGSKTFKLFINKHRLLNEAFEDARKIYGTGMDNQAKREGFVARYMREAKFMGWW